MRARIFFITGALTAVIATSGCSFKPELSQMVQVDVRQSEPAPSSASRALSVQGQRFRSTGAHRPHLRVTQPTDYTGMNCFVVSVNGPGIDAPISSSPSDPIPWDCLGLGALSTVESNANAVANGFNFSVPSGPGRDFQVYGVVTGGKPCGGSQLVSLLEGDTSTYMYLMGQTVQDVFQDGSSISIQNSYDGNPVSPAETTESIGSCLPDAYVDSGNAGNVTAYVGEGDPGYSDTLNSSLPPAGLDEFDLKDPYGFSSDLAAAATGWDAGEVARVDFTVWRDPTIPYGQYNTLEVGLTLNEGTVAASGLNCTTDTPTSSGTSFQAGVGTPPTYTVVVWNGASSQWLASTYIDTNGGHDFWDITSAQAAISGIPFLEGNFSGGEDYVHVSIRANDQGNGGATCSALFVSDFSFDLYR